MSEAGVAIPFMGDDETLAFLMRSANRELPSGSVFEIRAEVCVPPWQKLMVAWYWSDRIDQSGGLFADRIKGPPTGDLGYRLVARCVVGDQPNA